ncbi:MAG: NAD(P)/FAD-dependent oxidoreductase [Thermoleophilaceae bacterium]|jgi:dihydrolipoamide dehydrogenase|nr:NAD(P)/FAD-dependent oxidoreductase [Thermoleophilaceae bacterium]
MSDREFDVIVIGGGPAGEVLAGRLADNSDKSVAIVEEHLLGGECSYYACMPSKALLRPQEVLSEARRIPGAREAVNGGPDVSAVLERRDRVIHGLDDEGQVEWVGSRGIELVRGHGRLDGERRVRVNGEVLEAREAVVIAVGSGSAAPPIPGLADVETWTNREVTTTSEIPSRLIVLGGGVVGVEMAQAWHSLGSEVVIVELFDRLLAREEPFVGEELAAAFGDLGIEVRTGTKAVGAERSGEGVVLELDGGERVEGPRLLVATGRRPLTDDLGLESVGLGAGAYLEVDETLRVPGHPWLYAVGDVNGRALLTHMGKYQARLAADRIAFSEDGRIADPWGDRELRAGGPSGGMPAHGPASPRVVFTDPQVAAVGHTLASAREAGVSVKEVDLPTSGTAGASFYGRNAPGTTRFVVDTDREVLVGATFVGPEVADFLHAATIAVVGELPLRTLVHAVPPFPARTELWLKFLEAYGL